MIDLISVAELGKILKIELANSDPYARMIITQASNAVRDETGQTGWVGSDPGPGQTVAPTAAHDVTLWVAARAFTNPRNLERRTAGPISETFRDTGLFGVELTENEKARLVPHSSDDKVSSNGLWVQPTGRSSAPQRVYLADPAPGSTAILYADGGSLIAHIPLPEWETMP